MIHGVDEKHNFYVAPEPRPHSSYLGLYTWTANGLEGLLAPSQKCTAIIKEQRGPHERFL